MTGRLAVLGIVTNILLLIAKLVVGFISGSRAMIADGFNSAGDVFASVMTYIGNKMASKPGDKTHPFGHGKAEYIFSMLISISMVYIAFTVLRGSIQSILREDSFDFSWFLVATAAGTIVIKLSLFIYSKRLGSREDNLLILANAEDHRNDILVTSSVLIGILFGTWGIYWVDAVVGTCISIWIGYTGFRIFKSSFRVLMDTDMEEPLKNDIISALLSTEGVDHVDSVTAKPVGVRYIVIARISVPGDMTVNESHSIAGRIRRRLRDFKKVEDVIVHINPA